MNTDTYKTILEEEKVLLATELSGLDAVKNNAGGYDTTSDNNEGGPISDESDMDDKNEEYEEKTSETRVLGQRMTDVEEALNKIEKGTYGVCEKCGGAIEEDRLGANAAARTCKNCM